MSIYKRLHKPKEATEIIEQVEIKEEIKPPRSVKPIPQKHLSPIMEEVKSLKPVIEEMKANQAQMVNILEEMKKIYGKPQTNEAPENKPVTPPAE